MTPVFSNETLFCCHTVSECHLLHTIDHRHDRYLYFSKLVCLRYIIKDRVIGYLVRDINTAGGEKKQSLG